MWITAKAWTYMRSKSYSWRGTAALLDSAGNIVYPYCYESYEILDNGPLRFTVSLRYAPLSVDGDSAVIEERMISLDKGSWLNRTSVTYTGLPSRRMRGSRNRDTPPESRRLYPLPTDICRMRIPRKTQQTATA